MEHKIFHDDKYTWQIPVCTNLSLQAKGLLVWLMTLPVGYKLENAKWLADDTEENVKAALNELEKKRYIKFLSNGDLIVSDHVMERP